MLRLLTTMAALGWAMLATNAAEVVGGNDVEPNVTFAQPPTVGRPAASQQMSLPASQMTKEDWMPFLCDSVPSTVQDCRGVLDVNSHLTRNRGRFSPSSRKRRQLRNSFFDSSWPFNSRPYSPWNHNSRPNYNYGGQYPYGPNPTYRPPTSNTKAVVCPSAVDQSLVYQLSDEPTGYPAGEIGNELVLDPQLAGCLSRELVLSNTGPSVIYDNFRTNALPTCPYSQRRLWKYQDLALGSTCWVMANFGDFYFYTQCTQRFCQNCMDPLTQTQYPYDRYNPSNPSSYLYQKLCLTDYRPVSFWAYCPNNPSGARIVRSRIIVPVACNCQRVLCDLV